MNRRELMTLLGTAAAWPLAARAQQQGERTRRVGVLSFAAESDPSSQYLRKMSEELGKLGWSDGRNLLLEYRFAAGNINRTRDFAADLVRLTPEVIVASSGAAIRALQQETRVIPVV